MLFFYTLILKEDLKPNKTHYDIDYYIRKAILTGQLFNS